MLLRRAVSKPPVQVRHKGVWGTVCKDNFAAGEAAVFCRMLGFDGSSSSDYVNDVRPREGSWPTWINLRDSKCKGSESSIEKCHETGLWKHESFCGHDFDVVLTCQVCCLQYEKFHTHSGQKWEGRARCGRPQVSAGTLLGQQLKLTLDPLDSRPVWALEEDN